MYNYKLILGKNRFWKMWSSKVSLICSKLEAGSKVAIKERLLCSRITDVVTKVRVAKNY